MESTAFFEQKVALTPKNFNQIASNGIEELILEKVKEKLEDKCSIHGFVLPGTLKMISRSMGYFEPARFTGDAIYYVKAEGRVLYPADGVRVIGEVIRKNKMGLYVIHRDAIRVQVARDLHIGNEEFEDVQIGDSVEIELKKSKFQVNDPFILASGVFIRKL
jgi:DNA-directed RNA polymerase subunit E'/Rpb7